MTISCIIVSYNQKAYLKQAIESVLAQTRPVDEIIIADDASSDASQDLIRALAAEHQVIRPILRETNLGVAANRDLAIRSANGTFITTLDGDDLYYPSKIEHEWTALAAHRENIAYSLVALVDRSGSVICHQDLSSFSDQSLCERLAYVANRYGPLPRDMLYHKELYCSVGGIRPGLPAYEDWDLKIRLAAQTNQWLSSGSVGIAYRQTQQGLSSTSWRNHRLIMRRVLAQNQLCLDRVLGPGAYRRAVKNACPSHIEIIARELFSLLPTPFQRRLRPVAKLCMKHQRS